MVRFLLRRPIGTFSILTGIVALALHALTIIPLSLLPEIEMPEMRVRIEYPLYDARQLENEIVKPIRIQLAQLDQLQSVESVVRDGEGLITLRLAYGAPVQYLLLEANERIDALMAGFPRDMSRPLITKSSPSDIPVFYLRIYQNPQHNQQNESFSSLSEFVRLVIKHRLEQLPNIAFVDINGLQNNDIIISTDEQRMLSAGISRDELAAVIRQNNMVMGSIAVRDGHYQYFLKIARQLRSASEITELPFRKGDRIFRLGDFAKVEESQRPANGYTVFDGHQAVSLAIYKHPLARMQEMRREVQQTIYQLRIDFPEVGFSLGRDQTALLKISLNNLYQSLIVGLAMAALVVLLFIRNWRLAMLVMMIVPFSLLITVLFLRIFGLSINTISLSGLILGVGMMVDNSIIVIDNITQWRSRAKNLFEACASGTHEVITPLLSSALTTSAVFLPILLLSDLSGALFFDQAIAVTLSLAASFMVSITVLPVAYFLLGRKIHAPVSQAAFLENAYEKLAVLSLRNPRLLMAFFLMLLPAGFLAFYFLPKSSFPVFRQQEAVVRIGWNEDIDAANNLERIKNIINPLTHHVKHYEIFAGAQQFLLQKGLMAGPSDAELYLEAWDEERFDLVIRELTQDLRKNYPQANVSIAKPDNVFDMAFTSEKHMLGLRFRPHTERPFTIDEAAHIRQKLELFEYIVATESPVAESDVVRLHPKYDLIMLYNIDPASFRMQLERMFGRKAITELHVNGQQIPVIFLSQSRELNTMLASARIKNQSGELIPLKPLIELVFEKKERQIFADIKGEYLPVWLTPKQHLSKSKIIREIASYFAQHRQFRFDWVGDYFSNRALLKQLLFVLLVALALLFFILSAQFESVIQPFIVLSEILFALSGSLLVLLIAGSSLNIMSLMGVVVMAGITINDSILKVDTINRSLSAGMPLQEAILLAGRRRYKPILMTSLTTILAMLPLAFASVMGAELQWPLALAVIGGLSTGTLASLFLIPVIYQSIHQRVR